MAEQMNTFAFELYAELRAGASTLFFSPFSIFAAFAMTSVGARGATHEQLAAVLHTPPVRENFPEGEAGGCNISPLLLPAADMDKDGFALHVANRIWGQAGHSFLENFLSELKTRYQAELKTLDFERDCESARIAINDWTAEATNGLVKDLIPPGVIKPLTRLVLTNAIYFKGLWENEFDAALTEKALFYSHPGSAGQETDMMRGEMEIRHGATDSVQAIELPYKGGRLSMVVLLPPLGALDSFEQSLDSGRLESILNTMSLQKVSVHLPKWTMDWTVELSEAMKSLGAADAFDPDAADFSGMDGSRNLYITAALHKAYVEVNEQGTEAAAATAVIVGFRSIPSEPLLFNADHPFLYLIRDRQNGAILFMGRLAEPTQ